MNVLKKAIKLSIGLALVLAVLAIWTGTAYAGTGFVPFVPVDGSTSTGSSDGQFHYTQSVAVDAAGNVYVADGNNNRIQKFDANGTFITKWGSTGTGQGQFNGPMSIALDSAGNVYVADFANSRIQKFQSDGTFVTTWGSPGYVDGKFDRPAAVAIDGSNHVYVIDMTRRRVQKFDSNGTLLQAWGSYGDADNQLSYPQGITVDAAGNVYVSEYNKNQIKKFDTNGNLLKVWGSTGAGDGQFNYLQNLEMDSSGNIYAADRGNNRIQKFDSNGNFLNKWAAGVYPLNTVADIAVTSSGKMYVVDSYNSRIQVLAPALEASSTIKGQVITGLGKPSLAPGYVTAGTMNLTAQQAADTTGTAPFATVFNTGTAAAAVKTVKYASGGNTGNFATDAPYAGEPVTHGDFFVVCLTGTDSTSVYYRINTGVVPVAPVLQAPTAGNGQVSLSWNAVSGATGYKIYQSTTSGMYGAALATVGATSYTATGLNNGTTYYFTIKTTNSSGESPASNEVSAVPQTVPGAPTGVTATASNGEAAVSFTAPSNNGGSAITGYTVTSSPGNITASGAGAPITVSGLTNGTAYTFTVTAVNAAGTGPASTASNAVTPFAVITAAGVTGLSAPAAAAAPQVVGDLTAGHAGYTVTGLSWKDSDGTTPATLSGGKFKTGTIYKAVIELTAAAGYKFQTLTPTVSAGTPAAGTINVDAPGNKQTFTIAFPATATVTSVTVSPATAGVQRGNTRQFTAVVNGMDSPAQTVAWSVTGNAKAGTAISAGGLLTVAADETASSLTVKAASTIDISKSGTATVTVTSSNGGDSSHPSKTISVTETSSPLFTNSAGRPMVEANMDNAFSSSVEVKITDTAEDASAFGLEAGNELYPFDISLYIKGTNTKTQPANGYDVTISLPVPDDLLDRKEQLSIVHKSDSGTVTQLDSQLTQINGVWYLVFKAAEFSPYALVVDPAGQAAVLRLAGATRVETALAIAKAIYPGKIANAVLTTAENFPDSLAGSVLAYQLDAPVLLVGSSTADREKVLAYLQSNLEPEGTIYILGGTAVIDSSMEDKLKNGGFTHITRLAGTDRYETSVKIAEQLEVKSGSPVVLVSGEDYPDALSISSIAARNGYPVFLVAKDGINAAVSLKIAAIKPDKVYIIGLQGVISPEVENLAAQITGLTAEDIIRIGGGDRYATSVAVAQYFSPNPGVQTEGQAVCLATGRNFPDVLAGSIYAAKHQAPIILADGSLFGPVLNYLKSVKLVEAAIFGGEAAIGKDIEQQIQQLLMQYGK